MDLTVYNEFEKFFIENHPNYGTKNYLYISPFQFCRSEETFKKYLHDLYFNIRVFDWDELIHFFGVYERINYIYELDLGYSKYWHMFLNFLISDKQVSYDLLFELISTTMIQEQIEKYDYPRRIFYREMNDIINKKHAIKRKITIEESMNKRMKFN